MRQLCSGVATWRWVVGLAVTLVLPGWAHSEEPLRSGRSFAVGSKVRFQAPSVIQGSVQGRVMETDAETIVVLTESERPFSVSRQDITQLETSTGRRGHARKGLLIGAAVGAGIGAAAGATDSQFGCFESCPSQTRAEAVAYGLLVGAVGGAVCGAGVGALVKSERWSPVPLQQVRVSLGPTRGRGVRLSMSVGW